MNLSRRVGSSCLVNLRQAWSSQCSVEALWIEIDRRRPNSPSKLVNQACIEGGQMFNWCLWSKACSKGAQCSIEASEPKLDQRGPNAQLKTLKQELTRRILDALSKLMHQGKFSFLWFDAWKSNIQLYLCKLGLLKILVRKYLEKREGKFWGTIAAPVQSN